MATIKKYLTDNNLTDKINYIVLTHGIPYFSMRAAKIFHQKFDLYLLFALSESAVNNSIPDIFTYNEYFYFINKNYDNHNDYKFTRKKYGYYQVARLDGQVRVNIKKMLDSAVYPAHQ